jgi:uncharacterized protein YegJ (DUF2314 family)
MNAVASYAASTRTEVPITVTLGDAARIAGRTPAELAKSSEASRPIGLDTVDAERIEGDPENEMLELVPHGGATREAWTAALMELFGETARVVFAGADKELDAIATRARRDLPGAVKRFEAGEGSLFVKAPFPIPSDARIDGGASEEWMWMEVSSCDTASCAGLLSNTPGYATNLASGNEVKVERARAADWLLRLRDGGTTGGDSIKALRKR